MITLEHVSFQYGEQSEGAGVTDLNLQIESGECILVCGKSGCGKTTLLRLLNGLIPGFFPGTLEGTVTVDGKNRSEETMYELAPKTGTVFQNPRTQFFNVDTDSEIAFGMENMAMDPAYMKQRVAETARALQIENLCGRNIFELSGGEKQKIAFASVFALNPALFLLDEPSSNLDADGILHLKKQIALLKRLGKTILVTEHRLFYLLDLADRILYMDEGRIRKSYTPEEFLRLRPETLSSMGLRATDLARVPLTNRTFKPGEPCFQLENVSVLRNGRVLLDGLSFSAARGEVIAVTGPNGTGKTSLARALAGLHKEVEGRFLKNGREQSRKDRLRESFVVMQDVNYQLFAESVEAECAFGIRHPDRERIRRILDALDLTPFRDRHPYTLSGGQKQRTALASAIESEKEILILDEPTSGLDYNGMQKVAELIRKLSAQGHLLFLVTHDYELILETCSRILHLKDGALALDLPVTPETNETILRLFERHDF